MVPKVFIVILNWNRADDTIQCLESVGKMQGANSKLEVVLVDNASTDTSVKKIKGFFKKSWPESIDYKIIVNKENLGFAAGNNEGAKYALNKGADFIMLLNNDTVVDKNLLKEFLVAAEKYPQAGILSPKIYFAKGFEFHRKRYEQKDLGRVIWYAGGEIDWDNVYATHRGVDEVDKGQYDSAREIDFATGACMFLRAEVIRKVGLFNERYFMYLEDVDLSQRIKKRGWKVMYIPRAFLWHKVAQSSAIGGDLNDYFLTRNRLYFGMKYASARTKLALLKESIRLLFSGRRWQKIGVRDYYLARLGKGSWK